MQKNNTNNHNEKESFIEILLKTLSRIGNVLIMAFGMLFFGIKKLFTSSKKGGKEQSFAEFVKNLEDQLNASSKHYDLKRKTKSSFKTSKGEQYYNKHVKIQEPNYKIQKKTTTVQSKYKPKKSTSIKLLQFVATLVVISGVVILVGFAVSRIFVGGKKTRDYTAVDNINKTELEESYTYSGVPQELSFSSSSKEFLSSISPDPTKEAQTFESVMICGDEPLPENVVNTDIENETNPEASATVSTKVTTEPTPTVEVTTAPQVTMDINNAVFSQDILIHKGDTMDEVALVQERLMDLHYMDADEPTTFYGEGTYYAMQLFQRGHDLMVDGVAGYETLTLLFSDKATPYLVRQGDYGFDIYMIKNRLIELGYLNDDDSGKKFDGDTDYAVRIFQGRNKLSQDGIVGYNTTQVLFNGDAKPASNYTPPSSDSGGGGTSTGGGGSSASYDADSASDFVKYAKSCLDKGYTYVWGGKAPPGMDCSGFVYHSLNATGNNIGYMTSAAWAKSSYATISSMSDVKPGDILCFQGHVAIAIGDGKMIDSSSSSNTIRVANFESSSYWNRKWICAKRYFD